MNPAWTKVKYKYSYHFTSIGKLHVSTYTRIIIRVVIKTLLDSSRPSSDCVRRKITGSIFMKFGIWVFFFRKSLEKCQDRSESEKNNRC